LINIFFVVTSVKATPPVIPIAAIDPLRPLPCRCRIVMIPAHHASMMEPSSEPTHSSLITVKSCDVPEKQTVEVPEALCEANNEMFGRMRMALLQS
jgi:hypothetical protein